MREGWDECKGTHHVRAYFRFGTKHQFALLIGREFFAGKQLWCGRRFDHVMPWLIQHTKSMIVSVNTNWGERKIRKWKQFHLTNLFWIPNSDFIIIVMGSQNCISNDSLGRVCVCACVCVRVSVKHFQYSVQVQAAAAIIYSHNATE